MDMMSGYYYKEQFMAQNRQHVNFGYCWCNYSSTWDLAGPRQIHAYTTIGIKIWFGYLVKLGR
jgi:hypothetical protein